MTPVQDFVNSATEEQMKLHSDMHGSRNWIERPAEAPERQQRRLARLWIGLSIAGALACAAAAWWAGPVKAAERERPHAIVLLLKPTAIEWAAANEQRNQFVLSRSFRDRDTCERAKIRLVVMAKGGTVQCLPANHAKEK